MCVSLSSRTQGFFNNNFEVFGGITICSHANKVFMVLIVEGPEECMIGLRYQQFVDFFSGKEGELAFVNRGWKVVDGLVAFEEKHEPVS